MSGPTGGESFTLRNPDCHADPGDADQSKRPESEIEKCIGHCFHAHLCTFRADIDTFVCIRQPIPKTKGGDSAGFSLSLAHRWPRFS
jgi:hypothetical protein